ncbi:MAG: hypothetical protein IKE76_04785 [Clostridia bacterium]|nr:hypothetical protein [Clostridia bacterium]
MGDIDIKTGIVGFGFTIYQLDNPVVVTEDWNHNLLPRTGAPNKTSMTALAEETFNIPYGSNAHVQYPKEGSISNLTYVSLYRNDTGFPIMMCRSSQGEYEDAGMMVGVGGSNGAATGFQGFGTIYHKPKFTFLEPYYELTLAPGIDPNDYVWPNGRPAFPIKIYIDNQTHTYKLPNPIRKGNLFYMWDDDGQWIWGNNPNTSAPEQERDKNDYLATIAGGVTTIQFNTVKAIEDRGEFQCRDVALTPSFDTKPRYGVYPDTLTIGFDPQGGTINGKDYYFCEGYRAETGNRTLCVDVGAFVPEYSGKTFKGWCTDPNDPEGTLIRDTAPENSASWRKNGHMDVYAVWATSPSTPADDPAPSTPTTPASGPAPSTPASDPAPAVAVIPEISKNSKTVVSAAPGSVYQIDLGGATDTGFKSARTGRSPPSMPTVW